MNTEVFEKNRLASANVSGSDRQAPKTPALRVATVWLGGCSGCHMSFLDLDEWLIDLASAVQIVYSPIMDIKVYPENVDVVLVEGAIANEDHVEMMRRVRKNTKIVVALAIAR